jgi:glutamate carboxypeptidase
MGLSDANEIARVQRDANKTINKRFVPETEVTVKVENRRPLFSRKPQSDPLPTLPNQVYQELGKSIEPVAMRYGTDA